MKPKFTVKLTPRFSRDIKALDRNEQVKILRQVHVLETEPHAGKPLHGEFAGAYSLRIGNFRALYRIEGNQVFLLTVGHRKKSTAEPADMSKRGHLLLSVSARSGKRPVFPKPQFP